MNKEREYRFIDVDEINAMELRPVEGTCEDVLCDGLLDVIQLAEAEGMTEEEVDNVLRRIINYRAERVRKRFTMHTGGE
jgi:hypothetical protein